MKLSHVLMWTDEYGYQPVTDTEAALLYPKTVSACSKIFVCGICGQGLSFTSGKIRIRHFRHDQAAQNKECEERSQAYGYGQPTYSLLERIRSLPLRLIRQAGTWRLELGLLALQESIFENYAQQQLCIENDNGKKYNYNLIDRLHPDRLTWLDVGEQPSEYFHLFFNNGFSLPPLWPRRVEGMGEITLFEVETGYRLPFFPDVEVGKEYFAIIRGYCNLLKFNDILINYIDSSEHGWSGCSVYRVKALRFSKMAASFFIQLKANLKKHRSVVFPLWPAVIRTPHLIDHDADELFIFIEGEGVKVQAFPAGSLTTFVKREVVRLVRLSLGVRKQLVSGGTDTPLLQLGRFSHTLRYDYFIRQHFARTTKFPKVTVEDDTGNELKADRLETIQPRIQLYVQGTFDGEVWLQSESSPLIDKYTLKGGETLALKAEAGQTLTIFQGLDCVRTIVFSRSAQQDLEKKRCKQTQDSVVLGWTDARLCRCLKRMSGDEIEAPRVLAKCVHFFRKWPSVAAWLRQKQNGGCISKRAQILLGAVMNENKRRI